MKRLFRNTLTSLQKIILGILLVVAILLLAEVHPYRQETEKAADVVEYYFLQRGSYTLEITYVNSPADNTIMVFSERMPNDEGKMGVLYAEEEIKRGSGVIRIPFELNQGTYGVRVKMAEDGGDACTLESVILQSNNLIYKDNYFLGLLVVLCAVVLAYCFLMLPPERYGVPVALVLLGMMASIPLLSQSLIGGDDLQFHLTRLEGISLGLAAGEFPVRITPQQMSTYGGLTATMYPQLFLYPFAVLRLFGVSLINCYKLLLCSINVGTAFLAYYATRNICKSSRTALLMSFFYTFSMYRLTNMYTRAALGEVLAMTFLPLVIWGTYEILWGSRRWIVLVLGMTGVLGSHVLSVEMCALFMGLELIFWLLSKKKNQFVGRLFDGIKAIVVTSLLNAGFLVPFLYFCGEDLQCFILPPTTAKTVAYFSQMFSLFPSALGKNYSAGSTQGEMPITVGLVLLIGVFIFVYAYRKSEAEHSFAVGKHSLVFGVIALIMASWLFPWGKIQGVEALKALCSALQFTWRFLGLASVFLCLVLAIGLGKLLEEAKSYHYLLALTVGLSLIGAWNLYDQLITEQYQYTDTMELEGEDWSDAMYMYPTGDEFKALQLDYNREEAVPEVSDSSAIRFENYERKGSGLTVDVELAKGKKQRVTFPIYWYPGYKVFVDGEAVESDAYLGKVSCVVEGDATSLEVKYVGFWYFVLADVVTGITFAGIMCYGMYRCIRQKRGTAAKRV